MSTETVQEREINTLYVQEYAPAYPLKELADTPLIEHDMDNNHTEDKSYKTWILLTPQARASVIAHVEIYLDGFIVVVQGEPKNQTHTFYSLYEVFWPNNRLDTAKEEPGSLNDLLKGYINDSIKKTVNDWKIDTVEKVLSLPHSLCDNLELFWYVKM